MNEDKPIHLLVRNEKGLEQTACMTPVYWRDSNTTREKGDASCYKCAKFAPGLSDDEREDIRDNARRRLGRELSKPKRKPRIGVHEAMTAAEDEAD